MIIGQKKQRKIHTVYYSLFSMHLGSGGSVSGSIQHGQSPGLIHLSSEVCSSCVVLLKPSTLLSPVDWFVAGAVSLPLSFVAILLLPMPVGAPPLFHSKNLITLSSSGCISSIKTAIILLRGASVPVEFVLKYAMPTPVDESNIMNSAKSTVALSVPSSIVIWICPIDEPPRPGRKLNVPSPVSTVVIVCVAFGSVIVVFPSNEIVLVFHLLCFQILFGSALMQTVLLSARPY